MRRAYKTLVLTSFLPRSPALHAWAWTEMGFRAKGWGSLRWRAAVRMNMRACVGDGILRLVECDLLVGRRSVVDPSSDGRIVEESSTNVVDMADELELRRPMSILYVYCE